MVFFCNQAGNFATTSSCQSADWLALVLLNRLTDWVQFVRLHIIISLKANMFLPFRHQHSTQCVLDLEISHVSVNQGLRKSDDRVLFHGCSLFNFLIYLHISLGLIIFRSTHYFANSAKIWQLIFRWIVHLFTNFCINYFKFKT